MKSKLKISALIITLFIFITASIMPAAAFPTDESANYEWNNLKLGNYCWMTGMVIHPQNPNLIYVRTDVGGMYRFDPANNYWIQLLDGVDHNENYLLGVGAIAVDPTDENIVYAACGKSYGKSNQGSDILKSTDKGTTWERLWVEYEYGIYCGNDSYSRPGAESLMVDPNNTNIIYFGTQSDGLWKTTDGGATWRQIASVPENTVDIRNRESGGISQVYIDSRTVTQSGASKNIYVSAWGEGVFWSSDGGENFTLIPNTPKQPVQMQITAGSNGDKMYVASNQQGTVTDGGIYLYSGENWQTCENITPSEDNCNTGSTNWGSPGFGPFMIDSRNPDYIVIFSAPWQSQYNSWHSFDGGKTWRFKINAPMASAIIQDPNNLDNVWISAAQHIYYVENFADLVKTSGRPTVDYYAAGFANDDGVEGLVTNQIVSLPGENTPLALVGAMDHGLRVQEEWNTLENKTSPYITNLGGVDFCEEDPSYVFETGVYGSIDGNEKGVAAYSTNYGRIPEGGTANFIKTSWPEERRLIDCAVGATKQANGWPILMVQSLGKPVTQPTDEIGEGAGIWRSLDNGATWELMEDIAFRRNKTSNYINKRMLESDRVNGNVFYYSEPATDPETGNKYSALYRTKDGGDTWSIINMGSQSDYDWIKTVPFMEGGIWYYSQAQGKILASYDFGDTWTPIETITPFKPFGFGIGNGVTNPGLPAAYVVGRHDGKFGMFISDDLGETWTLISPETQKFSTEVIDICGDRNSYGSVFVSTGGRGALYGNGAPSIKRPEPEIPEGAITYRSGDKITLTVTAKNTTKNDEKIELVFAFYDCESGRLENSSSSEITVPAYSGKREYSAEITVPEQEKLTIMKGFVFKDLTSMQPLYDSVIAYEIK